MDYKVVIAVATEPVTLAEAKLHLRLDDIGGSHPDDALVTALISSAREYTEQYTGRALASQTLEAVLDCFPAYEDDYIDLPKPPVGSITSIKYTDSAGVEQTIAASSYALSPYGELRRVTPTYGNYWPSTQGVPEAVRIRYVAGYGGAAPVPATPKVVKPAMLLHIELNYPGNKLSAEDRDRKQLALDSLLNTIKIWGH